MIINLKGHTLFDSKANNTAQLGCGTFIIIAFIVMYFSGGRDSSRLQKSVDDLHSKVDRLEKKVDELSKAPNLQAVAPQPTAPTPEPTVIPFSR